MLNNIFNYSSRDKFINNLRNCKASELSNAIAIKATTKVILNILAKLYFVDVILPTFEPGVFSQRSEELNIAESKAKNTNKFGFF